MFHRLIIQQNAFRQKRFLKKVCLSKSIFKKVNCFFYLGQNITEDLQNWAIRYNVTDVAVRNLYHILKDRIPEIPSASSLIPKAPPLIRDERNYVYIGVEEQLKVSSCNQSQP